MNVSVKIFLKNSGLQSDHKVIQDEALINILFFSKSEFQSFQGVIKAESEVGIEVSDYELTPKESDLYI